MLTSVKSCGIYGRAVSWEDLKIPISKTRLKILFLESHSDLRGDNELNALFVMWPPSLLRVLEKKIHKMFFLYSIFPHHWNLSGCWTSPLTRTSPFHIVNTMAVDGLAMQGGRASAAMVLTQFFHNILVSATERSTNLVWSLRKCWSAYMTSKAWVWIALWWHLCFLRKKAKSYICAKLWQRHTNVLFPGMEKQCLRPIWLS